MLISGEKSISECLMSLHSAGLVVGALRPSLEFSDLGEFSVEEFLQIESHKLSAAFSSYIKDHNDFTRLEEYNLEPRFLGKAVHILRGKPKSGLFQLKKFLAQYSVFCMLKPPSATLSVDAPIGWDFFRFSASIAGLCKYNYYDFFHPWYALLREQRALLRAETLLVGLRKELLTPSQENGRLRSEERKEEVVFLEAEVTKNQQSLEAIARLQRVAKESMKSTLDVEELCCSVAILEIKKRINACSLSVDSKSTQTLFSKIEALLLRINNPAQESVLLDLKWRLEKLNHSPRSSWDELNKKFLKLVEALEEIVQKEKVNLAKRMQESALTKSLLSPTKTYIMEEIRAEEFLCRQFLSLLKIVFGGGLLGTGMQVKEERKFWSNTLSCSVKACEESEQYKIVKQFLSEHEAKSNEENLPISQLDELKKLPSNLQKDLQCPFSIDFIPDGQVRCLKVINVEGGAPVVEKHHFFDAREIEKCIGFFNPHKHPIHLKEVESYSWIDGNDEYQRLKNKIILEQKNPSSELAPKLINWLAQKRVQYIVKHTWLIRRWKSLGFALCCNALMLAVFVKQWAFMTGIQSLVIGGALGVFSLVFTLVAAVGIYRDAVWQRAASRFSECTLVDDGWVAKNEFDLIMNKVSGSDSASFKTLIPNAGDAIDEELFVKLTGIIPIRAFCMGSF